MESSAVRVQIYIHMVISCCLLLTSTVTGLNSLCSCYTFYTNTTNRDWDISRKECQANGGNLVSMETLAEWEFITSQIQNRTTSSGYNQWWIGLQRVKMPEGAQIWKWISSFNLTYNRWKKDLDIYAYNQERAIIEKGQGIFWSTHWLNKMGSICEKKAAVRCTRDQAMWCDIVTTTTITTTLRDSTTRIPKSSEQTTQATHKEPTTSKHYTTSPQFIKSLPSTQIVPASTKEDTYSKDIASSKKDESSFEIIIIIVVVVIVVVIIIVIIILCVCRRRRNNRDKHKGGLETKMSKEEKEQFIMKPPPNMYEEESSENPASLNTSPSKNNKEQPEPVYAVVDKVNHKAISKSKKKKPKELNYAALSDIKPNDSQDVQKPTPYEHTEYAVIVDT